MIGSLAMRPARSRQTQARRKNVTWESRRVRPRRTARVSRPRVAVSFGAGGRLFVLSAGMLATAFLLALLYLRFATSIAAGGYDLHSLEARRDELQRENALLQLQRERLASPARIEAAAKQLGLVKADRTLFLTAGSSVTLK